MVIKLKFIKIYVEHSIDDDDLLIATIHYLKLPRWDMGITIQPNETTTGL